MPNTEQPLSRPETFWWPARVYYEDTDAGGVVYHANYLRFFERARTEYLRSLGIEQDAVRREFGVLFAVRSLQIDYLWPARFNDVLCVSVEPAKLRRVSCVFRQTAVRGDLVDRPLCQATVQVVCLDEQAWRVAPIPNFILTKLQT